MYLNKFIKTQERAEKELKKLQDTIKTKEGELQELKPKYEAQKKKEEDCTREYVEIKLLCY